MGRSKVELFAAATIAKAQLAFDDVIVVQRRASAVLPAVKTIHDAPAGAGSGGAILGVLAALRHARGACFILAVDYPLLTTGVLHFLRERFEAGGAPLLVPEWQGRPQLLCAGYGPAIVPAIEQELAEGRFALRALLEVRGAEIIPEHELRGRFPGEPLMNVNTPAELRDAESIDGRA